MLKYILSIVSLLFMFFSMSYAWSYPIKQLSKPTARCKFNLWKNLWPDCKINLPKLTPDEYKTKIKDMFYRRIYTVLWAATYKYWWDQMNGTHLWVDIATSKWTPVYAIWDGKVIFVWYKGWRWNVIVIRHKFKWKYIYSNYAHLSKIVVVSGQDIKEWTKIWEVWSTWHATWNHLHFQIDKNQSIWHHPFWFGSCSKWHSILSIVDWTFCLPDVIKNTVDPLKFLATNGANVDFKTDNVKQEKIIKTEKISRKWMKSLEDIRKEMVEDFLRNYKFSFKFEKWWVYQVGEYGHFTISLKDFRARDYHDILPWDLNIIYDKNYFSAVFPRTLKVLNGIRTVSFRTKKTWITFITVKLWNHFIYQKTIRIVKKWSYITPSHARIITLPNNKYVWDSSRGINLFQDNGYINIIRVPFAWTYNISAKNIKICKAPNNIKKLKTFKCNAYNMYDKFKFFYSDTIDWLLVFKYVWQKKWLWEIVIKDKKWNVVAKSKNLYFNDVQLINKKTLYTDFIQSACKKWLCLWILQNGYIWNNRVLNYEEFKYLVRNFLLYFWKKVNVNISYNDKWKTLTRKDFVSKMFTLLWIKIKDYTDYRTNYIDLRNIDNNFKNQVKYLTKLWFTWKDPFKRYFQPNKKIELQEALHLLNFLIEKYTH